MKNSNFFTKEVALDDLSKESSNIYITALEEAGIKVSDSYAQSFHFDKITGFVESFLTPFNKENAQNQKDENINRVIPASQDSNNEFIIYARLTQEIVNLFIEFENLKSAKFISALRGDERNDLVNQSLLNIPDIEELQVNNIDIDCKVIFNNLNKLSIQGHSDIQYSWISGCKNLEYINITNQPKITVKPNSTTYVQKEFNDLSELHNFFEGIEYSTIKALGCLGDVYIYDMHGNAYPSDIIV